MQKICPHCGAFMPTEAVFCLHCFSANDISEKPASPRGGATSRKKSAVRRGQYRIEERCTASILLVTLLTSMFFSFASGSFSAVSALHTFTRGDGLFTATHHSDKPETAEAKADGEKTEFKYKVSGKYSFSEDQITLRYIEPEETGLGRVSTHLHLGGGCVTVRSFGDIKCEMKMENF